MLGHDFLVFYVAGDFARQGHFDRLYDLGAMKQAEQAVAQQNGLELGDSFGPWWYPPFYAWIFAPLSTLPYGQALAVWTGINLACALGATVLLVLMLPQVVARPPRSRLPVQRPLPVVFSRDWRNWALVPLLLCLSMPFVQALGHGQNTCTSLLLLTLTVTAWRKQMPLAAGLACGLMFYKPQLAATVAVMLILSLGVRAFIGLGLTGSTLLLICTRTMPGALEDYLYRLPGILQAMQVDRSYLWDRHATLVSLWRMLFQGYAAGPVSLKVLLLTVSSSVLIGLGLLGAWWRTRKIGRDSAWMDQANLPAAYQDRLILATITAMPLLSPFYFDYDLLLLAVGAVVLASQTLAMPAGVRPDRLHRLLIGLWIALYAWLMVNPPLTRDSGVNVTVVLLATACAVSIVRACHWGLGGRWAVLPEIQHVIVRRAA